MKAATKAKLIDTIVKIFQSTPPVKAATCLPLYFLSNPAISIHAAREGGDVGNACSETLTAAFQSTPPVKAATGFTSKLNLHKYISIHAAREGGDTLSTSAKICPTISIHAAREGGDGDFCFVIPYLKHFNPRRP